MNHTKHCPLLRQVCPEPFVCGNGCQVVKRDAPDLPVVMFDKPYQWLSDLFFTTVYAAGVVSCIAVIGLAVGYFYARYFV